jgi:hypothetical protein
MCRQNGVRFNENQSNGFQIVDRQTGKEGESSKQVVQISFAEAPKTNSEETK